MENIKIDGNGLKGPFWYQVSGGEDATASNWAGIPSEGEVEMLPGAVMGFDRPGVTVKNESDKPARLSFREDGKLFLSLR